VRRDVIARALASAVELDTVETRYRGHAVGLASGAAPGGYGLVITLGGDGTVNEAVNGLLRRSQGRSAAEAPALAALPGGSANVFIRALGLPPDPVDAAGQVLDALAADRCRSVGVGLAGGRYFTFNSGMGIDAEVVRAVEGRRAHGRPPTPALYVRTAMRQFYRLTDRRHPALTLHQPDGDGDGPLFWATVSNTTPWTYLGSRAVSTNPQASFDTGLDVFGMRSLRTLSTLTMARQMMSRRAEPPRGRAILARHNLAELTLQADRPVAFQIDGEYVGEREQVRFLAVPDAIRVVM